MKFLQKKRFIGILLLIIGQLFFNSAWADDNSSGAREKRVADLKQKLEYIQYGATKPKAVVYVFTDMNCSFCRKLHHEFPKLADQGIQVRVLAMPRQGLDSPGFKEWVSIWCSKDQNDSLDRAMEGEEIAPKTCKNPIKMHYSLGRKWGVIGTPSVLFADGTLKAGYFSADKLAKEAIKRSAAMEKTEEKPNDENEKSLEKTTNKGEEQTKGGTKSKTKANTKNNKDNKKSNVKETQDNAKEKTTEKTKDMNANEKNGNAKADEKNKDKDIDKDKDKGKDKDKDKDKGKDKTKENNSKSSDAKGEGKDKSALDNAKKDD